MNPLHYIRGTGINEYLNNWILPWVMPVIVASMYDETEIEKRIKFMKGEPDGKQGN
jgi:hypothetical protein